MHAVGRLGSYISRGVYTVSGPFHPFGGAVDIIVVEQPDGSFKSSPWYVRFGKFQGVLKTREKVVDINVNGTDVNFHMFIDHKGEAYFLREVDGESESVPFPFSSGDEMDEREPLSGNRRTMKSKILNYATDKSNSAIQVDASNGKILARSSSRRSRTFGFGFVFGQRSRKEEAGGAEIERVSSLERAEIAADLLEVKWSTGLTTSRLNKKAARVCSSNDAFDSKGAEEDMQINSKEYQFDSSVQDKEENSIDHLRLLDETEICDQEKVSSSHSVLESLECSVEEASKQGVETSSKVEGLLEEKRSVVSNVSGTVEEPSVGNSDRDENETGAPSGMSAPYMQSQYMVEAFSNQQFDEEIAQSETNANLPGFSISSEETVSDRVQSFIYCETSDSSVVTLEGISEQTHETMCISDVGNGKVHIHAEKLVTPTELVPEVTILKQTEDIELESEGASTVSESYSQVLGVDPVIGSMEETKSNCIHSPSTVGYLCDQVEDEKMTKDALQSVGDSECFAVTEPVPKVTVLWQTEDIELDSQGSLTVSESYSEVVNVDPLIGSVEETKSYSSHNSSAVSALFDQVEDEKNIKDALHSSLESVGDSKNFYGDSSPQRSVQPSESSEDEQFLFSDLNESKLCELDCVNKDHHSSIFTETEKLNGSFYNESYSNTVKVEQENPSNDLESSVENSKIFSGSISICRNNKERGENAGWQAESLPNMWSSVSMNEQPLSHSLDSKSETLKWASIRKDDSSCIRSDTDEERPAHTRTGSEDSETTALKSALHNSSVEISLCKHLLYEGMGAEAASQVFDAEKLDSKTFSTFGPTVVKNERLVVRIRGRYFPWDTAVPILLGMVAFGNEEIFELKGMIHVDRVEKSIEGIPPIAIVSPSGSWRLWPFSFRRSRSMNAVQPVPLDTKSLDAVNAVEKTVVSGDDKILLKTKRVKKMTRALTPTSEQLASLNLKDGMNHVKFTFSTPMLGKQQVDARIYRWKWNTRIVISDVDGTITRSDVLGQFMPLVGIDWSQTGVAHLFSAIKENGYELIFLSARAISQAYTTRRFLLNLKQDGKALPGGPIVISPDGLFPSLYREVIRRAPHEFKIACLEDIKALFPSDCSPFYAGFGNRDTDEFSYLKVGIPKGKIFIINPKGEVVVNRRVDSKSYRSLHALVHDMFPPPASSEQEDYNSWNYWKLPPPLIDM